MFDFFFRYVEDLNFFKKVAVFKVIVFILSKYFMKTALICRILVLKNYIAAGPGVVLLVDWVFYSFFLSRICVDSHFSSFIVEEVNVDRITACQSCKDSHALRQKHILPIMLSHSL